jgi:Mn2+/Fe2+ NRAMP family transporter
VENKKSKNLSVLIGAGFLMATSAVGPSFLTQTGIFTQQLGATFGFVILVALIMSIIVQITVWRVIGISNLKGQEIANKVMPGMGYVLTILIVVGCLIFNIGNVAGTAMGLNVIFGINLQLATVISVTLAVSIFLSKEANKAMDKMTQIMGVGMILLIVYVAIASHPPVGEAIKCTFLPKSMPFLAILTLVGGTVGGYHPFAGGHRLLEGNIYGKENIKNIDGSASLGLVVTTIIRVGLFLAVLGVVAKGISLNVDNPTADAFLKAAGTLGYKFFGIVLFCASITSVVGATYTSMTFLSSLTPKVEKNRSKLSIAFILFSGLVFMLVGKPAAIMILTGALNGLVLPITLFIMLWAVQRKDIIGDYKHPKWLLFSGYIVFALMLFVSIRSLGSIGALFK